MGLDLKTQYIIEFVVYGSMALCATEWFSVLIIWLAPGNTQHQFIAWTAIMAMSLVICAVTQYYVLDTPEERRINQYIQTQQKLEGGDAWVYNHHIIPSKKREILFQLRGHSSS